MTVCTTQILLIFGNGKEVMYNFDSGNLYYCGFSQISVIHAKVSIKNMEKNKK